MRRFGLLIAFVASMLAVTLTMGCGGDPTQPTGGTTPNTKQVAKEGPGGGGFGGKGKGK